MKKKYLAIALLVIGITLICGSIILAAISTADKNIIGGADIPTFLFVFFRENRGLYFGLSCLGIVSMIASVAMGVFKK